MSRFRAGTRVRFHDLYAKELNARVGVVVSDKTALRRGRVPVLLDGSKGHQVNGRPGNARVLAKETTKRAGRPCRSFRPNKAWITGRIEVVVRGLQRMPELNGKRAQVVGYDEIYKRYLVRLTDGCVENTGRASKNTKVLRVQPRHFFRWFEPGAEVLIQGHSKKFDGERACIDSFLQFDSTYVVRLSANSELKQVHPENVCPCHSTSNESAHCENRLAADTVQDTGCGEADDNDVTNSGESLDVLKQNFSASSVFSSSSLSSDDGFQLTPWKKRCRTDENVRKPFMPRSMLRSVAAKTVREAERQVLKEEAGQKQLKCQLDTKTFDIQRGALVATNSKLQHPISTTMYTSQV